MTLLSCRCFTDCGKVKVIVFFVRHVICLWLGRIWVIWHPKPNSMDSWPEILKTHKTGTDGIRNCRMFYIWHRCWSPICLSDEAYRGPSVGIMILMSNSPLILSLKISGVLALCPFKHSPGAIQCDSLYLCLFYANYMSKFEVLLETLDIWLIFAW